MGKQKNLIIIIICCIIAVNAYAQEKERAIEHGPREQCPPRKLKPQEAFGETDTLNKQLKALINKMKSNSYDVRMEATAKIIKIGPAAVPALIKAVLEGKEHTIRQNAAQIIGKMGPAAKAAVPALIKALEDKSWSVQYEAAEALGKIGPDAKDAVGVLTKILTSEAPDHISIRNVVVVALGNIGPEARDAVGALTNILEGKHEYETEELYDLTVKALVKIGPILRLIENLNINPVNEKQENKCWRLKTVLYESSPEKVVPALMNKIMQNIRFMQAEKSQAIKDFLNSYMNKMIKKGKQWQAIYYLNSSLYAWLQSGDYELKKQALSTLNHTQEQLNKTDKELFSILLKAAQGKKIYTSKSIDNVNDLDSQVRFLFSNKFKKTADKQAYTFLLEKVKAQTKKKPYVRDLILITAGFFVKDPKLRDFALEELASIWAKKKPDNAQAFTWLLMKMMDDPQTWHKAMPISILAIFGEEAKEELIILASNPYNGLRRQTGAIYALGIGIRQGTIKKSKKLEQQLQELTTEKNISWQVKKAAKWALSNFQHSAQK